MHPMFRKTATSFSFAKLGSVLLLAGGFVLGGCTEQVTEYAKFGGWSNPTDRPLVLSGNPEEDSVALAASRQVLSENDWQTLEKIAPRPIWERIARMRDLFTGGGDRDPDHEANCTEKETLDRRVAEIKRTVPIDKLEDGKVQIFYTLQHYGGPEVHSRRDGGTSRREITLKQTSLAPIVALVNKHLAGKGTVESIDLQNKLIITCPGEMQDRVLRLLANIDSAPKQVEISARIFEVSHDFDFQYGAHALIKHIASDNTQSLSSTFSTKDFLDSLTQTGLGDYSFQGSALRLMKVFQDAGITLDATFQALADMGLIKVVASPRMTVSVSQTAYMLAGQELPIQSAKISNDQIVTERTTYKPIGVQLYITPQAAAGKSVKLHVVTSVTAVSGFAPVPAMTRQEATATVVNPIIDSREAETFVTVKDGSTLVIGGLRMIRTVTRERKVPGLGDIRGMEWLFKNHRSQNLVNDLYFFVTPKVIKEESSG